METKGQLDAKDRFFIAKLIVRSTCFGHHCAHHQELKIYTDGCCLWYLALWFTGWSGVELWVMYLVCRMLLEQHPANRTRNPQLHTRLTTCKPKRQVPQAAVICITLDLMMAVMVPETC